MSTKKQAEKLLKLLPVILTLANGISSSVGGSKKEGYYYIEISCTSNRDFFSRAVMRELVKFCDDNDITFYVDVDKRKLPRVIIY